MYTIEYLINLHYMSHNEHIKFLIENELRYIEVDAEIWEQYYEYIN